MRAAAGLVVLIKLIGQGWAGFDLDQDLRTQPAAYVRFAPEGGLKSACLS